MYRKMLNVTFFTNGDPYFSEIKNIAKPFYTSKTHTYIQWTRHDIKCYTNDGHIVSQLFVARSP